MLAWSWIAQNRRMHVGLAKLNLAGIRLSDKVAMTFAWLRGFASAEWKGCRPSGYHLDP